MEKYFVKYAFVTKSRCGSYVYNVSDTVEANSPEELKEALKNLILKTTHYKRFTIRIKSFEKVN